MEVLADSRAEAEIPDKLGACLAGGTRLAWIIDPRRRTARVYSGSGQATLVDEAGTLTGGDVLPGSWLPLRELFAELNPPPGT